MTNVVLSESEKLLSGITAIVLLASILLALCISLVLPIHWTNKDYVSRNTKQDVSDRCKCAPLNYATHDYYLDCTMRVLPGRFIQKSIETTNRACELIQNYPYLVSLNAPAYIDDISERRYACAGTIVSNDWVLIGRDCVLEDDELKDLKIRAGSAYWSKGGTEYDIQVISKFGKSGPIALSVYPSFVFDQYVKPITLVNEEGHTSWISAVSIGWAKNNMELDKFVVRRWTTKPCLKRACNTGDIIKNPESVCHNQKLKSSLVTDTRLLVGFEVEICRDAYNNTKTIFMDVQNEELKKWFRYAVNSNENHLKSISDQMDATPIRIYEIKDCVSLDTNFLDAITGDGVFVTETVNDLVFQGTNFTSTNTTNFNYSGFKDINKITYEKIN